LGTKKATQIIELSFLNMPPPSGRILQLFDA